VEKRLQSTRQGSSPSPIRLLMARADLPQQRNRVLDLAAPGCCTPVAGRAAGRRPRTAAARSGEAIRSVVASPWFVAAFPHPSQQG